MILLNETDWFGAAILLLAAPFIFVIVVALIIGVVVSKISSKTNEDNKRINDKL